MFLLIFHESVIRIVSHQLNIAIISCKYCQSSNHLLVVYFLYFQILLIQFHCCLGNNQMMVFFSFETAINKQLLELF